MQKPVADEPVVGMSSPSLVGHLQIARFDHWVKNVFVLPGIIVALGFDERQATVGLVPRIVLGLLATGLVASSNYVINEVLDAPYDRTHPTKCRRPVPSGRVNVPLAYVQWIAMGAAGVALGRLISWPFAITMLALWFMGVVYNIPPVRSKELPYLDVISEAVNNPLRMLAGWFIVGPAVVPPASLLVSYWMVGCYFMAIKRYSELRYIFGKEDAVKYRKSFAYYTLDRLLVSIVFYGSAAMLCFGAFIVRYRAELLLAFPLVALVMSLYLQIAFKDESAAQNPEKLYRERPLMLAVCLAAVLMTVLLLVDIPIVRDLIAPRTPAVVQSY
jgi:4-hydroxybenzoate polyprenyltransferase